MDCFRLFSAITSAPDSLRTEDLGRHVWGMFVLQKCEHSPGPVLGGCRAGPLRPFCLWVTYSWWQRTWETLDSLESHRNRLSNLSQKH